MIRSNVYETTTVSLKGIDPRDAERKRKVHQITIMPMSTTKRRLLLKKSQRWNTLVVVKSTPFLAKKSTTPFADLRIAKKEISLPEHNA